MNVFNTILVLAAAFLAVFGETVFSAPRHLFGAQIDLLPALMIYAALNTNVVSVSILAVAGGLWFDALSANRASARPGFTAVRYWLSNLRATRIHFARTAVRPAFSRRACQRARSNFHNFNSVERRQRTVAWLGFALAMDCDDRRRRGGDTDFVRAVRLVQSRARLSVADGKQFRQDREIHRDKKGKIKIFRCSYLTNLKNDPQLRLVAMMLAAGLS